MISIYRIITHKYSYYLIKIKAICTYLNIYFYWFFSDFINNLLNIKFLPALTTLLSLNLTTLLSSNLTTLLPPNLTVLLPSNLTTLLSSNLTILLLSNLTTLLPLNLTTLLPSNLTTLLPSNLTTLSPNSTIISSYLTTPNMTLLFKLVYLSREALFKAI
jgi:hypothetical protein